MKKKSKEGKKKRPERRRGVKNKRLWNWKNKNKN